jgi:hypothetical protein
MRVLVAIGGETDAVLAFLTATQHLAALVVGVLIYVILRRLEVVTWLALVGAGVFLFDAFSLSVEQTILRGVLHAVPHPERPADPGGRHSGQPLGRRRVQAASREPGRGRSGSLGRRRSRFTGAATRRRSRNVSTT